MAFCSCKCDVYKHVRYISIMLDIVQCVVYTYLLLANITLRDLALFLFVCNLLSFCRIIFCYSNVTRSDGWYRSLDALSNLYECKQHSNLSG